MTNQELHQLATEYAEQNPPADLKDEVLKGNLIGLNTEIFEKFLIWLTKAHCIVSREKVRGAYNEIFHGFQLYNDDLKEYLTPIKDVESCIKKLFGESTFEERSEK